MISHVLTRDGRSLEVLTGGDPDGLPLMFHGGSPSAVVPFAAIEEPVAAAGMRLISCSRPGYGDSTPRLRDQPRFVDDVDDTVDLLSALGVSEFVTLGWSGGGPRALATAARVRGCLAAATLAGVGPRDLIGGEAWSAGMAEENVAEYGAAAEGHAAYATYLEREFLPILQAGPDDLAEGMGGLLPPADRAALDRPFLEWLTETFHRAAAQGIAGVLDDGLAAVAPWGFELDEITVPVTVHQGRQDAMVPFAHGEWLAAHVPGATAHLTDDDGHLTLITRLPEILADLRQSAQGA